MLLVFFTTSKIRDHHKFWGSTVFSKIILTKKKDFS